MESIKTIEKINVDKKSLETEFLNAICDHLLPVGRQMAVKNTVSSDFLSLRVFTIAA